MKFSSLTLAAGCSALGIAFAGSYALAGGAAIPKHIEKEVTSALEETPKILSAPPSDARRVYVTDPADFAATTRIVTIDGKFFAHASTVFSRVSKGTRDDYIELYDAQSHNVIADIDIPEVRFL